MFLEKVKVLYYELQLKKFYEEYEEESYIRIFEFILQKFVNLLKEMFLEFVKKIYK